MFIPIYLFVQWTKNNGFPGNQFSDINFLFVFSLYSVSLLVKGCSTAFIIRMSSVISEKYFEILQKSFYFMIITYRLMR